MTLGTLGTLGTIKAGREQGLPASSRSQSSQESQWSQLSPTGQRKRYRIIDQEQLLTCLGMPGQWEAFRTWHAATLAELCARPATPAEPYWSSAFAVGTPKWLSSLGGGRMNVSEYIESIGGDGEDDLHTLRLPQSVAARLWRWLGDPRTREKH